MPTWVGDVVMATPFVAALFKRCRLKQKIRLIGVGASGLINDTVPIQMDMFTSPSDPGENTWEKVDQTLDRISRKFGNDAVRRASLADNPGDRKT